MKTRNHVLYEWGLLGLLTAFWGLVGLNRVGIAYIFPQIVPEFRMTFAQAGLLISGTSITWAISSWVGGWLSDRYGRRRVLLPAAGLACLMTAAMGAAWSFVSMFVVRDLIGIGDGVGWSVGEATVAEESAPTRRGFNQAVFTAGYTLVGAGLGALIVTGLTRLLGWRWVFPIVGGVALLVVAGLWLVMREPAAGTATAAAPADWRQALGMLRSPSVLVLILLGCAVLGWLQVSVGFNLLFLTRVRHLPGVEAGAVASAWGLAGVAGQTLLPRVSDYLGRRPVVIGSALLSALALLVYVLGAFPVAVMAALLGASGFFGWALIPIGLASCVSEAVPHDLRAAALGVTNCFAVIVGTTLLPVVAGAVADHAGLASAMLIAAACLAVSAVAMLGLRETAPRLVAREAASRPSPV